MALDTTKLSAVGTGAGQKLWLYNSGDSSTTIQAANYFTTTDIPNMSVYDIILAVCPYQTGGTPSSCTLKMAVTVINSTRGSVVYLP
jgi:hypothetical protein